MTTVTPPPPQPIRPNADSAIDPHPPATEERDHRASARRVTCVGYVVVALVTAGMLLILGRVAQLQTHTPPQVARLIDTQHGSRPLPERRGALLDREGRDIAPSDTYHRLFVDPRAVVDPSTFAERVAHALGYDPARIDQLIVARPRSRFIVIDQRVSPERLARLSELNIPGLGLELRQQRRYPLGSLAGQVVGFVGFDGIGLEGAERVFNTDLTGSAGRLVSLRDAARRPLWVSDYQAPADGRQVRLSIDATIQAIAERELRKTCDAHEAKSGQLIVMHPHSGEILAMANYPSFDPNHFRSAQPDNWRNRAVTDLFEPGSIFKPIIWAAATQLGYALPGETIHCENGLWVTFEGRRLRDAHGYGGLTWDGVLIKSSNIGMGKVGLRMGVGPMHRAVRAFGFGEAPGSELPGESPGLVHRPAKWTHYSVTSVPMGQEIGVTPLQMARAFCVFGNDGLLIRPTLRATHDPRRPGQGRVIGRVLATDVARHTRWVLRRVVLEGTGRKARSDLYSIWGKTGTAQIAASDGRGYLPRAYVGSFIGGAPYEDPQLIVGCFVRHPNPDKGYYGGLVSAPAVKQVIEEALPYLGVAPDRPGRSRSRSVAMGHGRPDDGG